MQLISSRVPFEIGSIYKGASDNNGVLHFDISYKVVRECTKEEFLDFAQKHEVIFVDEYAEYFYEVLMD